VPPYTGRLGVWRSLVARRLWVAEVPGSNPGTPIASAIDIRRWIPVDVLRIGDTSLRMEAADQIKRRVERVQLETDRHVIVGNVTLPPGEGYQSRFSDSLNRANLTFIPLVEVEIWPLDGGEAVGRDLVIVNKEHVRLAVPIEEVPLPDGPGGPPAAA
jgi:uncharacterized protein DUF6812